MRVGAVNETVSDETNSVLISTVVSPASVGHFTYNDDKSPKSTPVTANSGVARFVKLSVELCPTSDASVKSAAFGTDGRDTSTTIDEEMLVSETFPAESSIV